MSVSKPEMITVNYRAVKGCDHRRDRIRMVTRGSIFSGAFAQSRRHARVSEQPYYLRSQAGWIARLAQQPIHTVRHDLRYPSGVSGNQRTTVGHGLDDNHPEDFEARRYDCEVSLPAQGTEFRIRQPA
jgi:hypothetical protein